MREADSSRLSKMLTDADIPIDGVVGDGPNCKIQFRPEATEAQQQQAEQIKKDFDWRERKPKDPSVLRAEIQALGTADAAKLDEADRLERITERLLSEPGFARKLGVAIDGDELA